MRNRVAPTAARVAAVASKLVLVMVLVPATLVGAATAASAVPVDGAAAESGAFGILGPVGIAAVVIGFGGLVVGLLRHRRRESAAVGAAVDAAVGAVTVRVPVDASGTLPGLDAQVEPATGERVG